MNWLADNWHLLLLGAVILALLGLWLLAKADAWEVTHMNDRVVHRPSDTLEEKR